QSAAKNPSLSHFDSERSVKNLYEMPQHVFVILDRRSRTCSPMELCFCVVPVPFVPQGDTGIGNLFCYKPSYRCRIILDKVLNKTGVCIVSRSFLSTNEQAW